jgi:hypothetical protein
MSTVDGQSGPGGSPSTEPADLKLEAVAIPVAGADRSKAFYAGPAGGSTPISPSTTAFGSCNSRHRDRSVLCSSVPTSPGAPLGCAHGLYLIVSDIDAGRDELVSRGATVSGMFHSGGPGAQLDPEGTGDRANRPDPDHKSYNSFATFEDPDGNGWLLREVTDRLPGRLDPTTTSFNSAGDLATALHRAESIHAEAEKRIGQADPDWPNRYAEYMVREQNGQEIPV